ncbi:MAG TPA: hemerythrin domain-containing protein [Phenylobacterium sp.]|jgi:hemerythrin-like domain-containing protein|nr:hemerythrin domain-containing protein [Phenylobacterium sp.]
MTSLSRRAAFTAATGLAVGAALALPGCAKREGGEDVSATEDLMREHGVLRRILVVYREVGPVLRTAPASLDAAALGQAAGLFKTFGEDYHEKKLEEQHIFPAVQKTGGEAGGLVATLLAQHDRGREITAYVTARCASGKVAIADAEPLARALGDFARMYEAHTAYEDTIVFQAWRKSLSKAQLKEAGDQFEDIERAQFKGDGFDMAVDQITQIEQRLGLHDLGRFTAPAPG